MSIWLAIEKAAVSLHGADEHQTVAPNNIEHMLTRHLVSGTHPIQRGLDWETWNEDIALVRRS
jgi:hypothetical protein